MKGNSLEEAKRILTDYLEKNNCRRTHERYAVLEAAYGFRSSFSVRDLSERLARERFAISPATVYNALKLFMRLRLVACHRLECGLRYEATMAPGTCVRICTACGKAVYQETPAISRAVEGTRFTRFRMDSYAVFVYGLCSSCQAVRTRLSKREGGERPREGLKDNKENKQALRDERKQG